MSLGVSHGARSRRANTKLPSVLDPERAKYCFPVNVVTSLCEPYSTRSAEPALVGNHQIHVLFGVTCDAIRSICERRRSSASASTAISDPGLPTFTKPSNASPLPSSFTILYNVPCGDSILMVRPCRISGRPFMLTGSNLAICAWRLFSFHNERTVLIAPAIQRAWPTSCARSHKFVCSTKF